MLDMAVDVGEGIVTVGILEDCTCQRSAHKLRCGVHVLDKSVIGIIPLDLVSTYGMRNDISTNTFTLLIS